MCAYITEKLAKYHKYGKKILRVSTIGVFNYRGFSTIGVFNYIQLYSTIFNYRGFNYRGFGGNAHVHGTSGFHLLGRWPEELAGPVDGLEHTVLSLFHLKSNNQGLDEIICSFQCAWIKYILYSVQCIYTLYIHTYIYNLHICIQQKIFTRTRFFKWTQIVVF